MSKSYLNVLVVSIFMVMPLCVPCRSAENGDVLLNYVPEDVNTIAIVRVEEILKSPRGRREGWSQKSASEFLGGAAMIPPWVKTAVRASHVHPGAPESSWSVGLLPWPGETKMADLALYENSEVQTIAGNPAVHSEIRNAYFTELVPGVLGILTPGLRQDLARWIRSSQVRRAPEFPAYLQNAATSSAGQIVMAIDMDELLEPKMVEARLQASTVFRRNPRGAEKLAELMRSLKGIRFVVEVHEETTARLQFDFSKPVEPEAAHLKDVLIEFLEDAGAMLEDLQESTVKLENESVILQMKLSDSGLRRIMSLILSPPPTAILLGSEESSAPARDEIFEASKRYFHAVDEILDDLERSNRRAKNYAKTAQWHENFAEKIAQLPPKNVERDLLEFGSSAGSNLRALAASLQGVSLEVNTLEKTITYNVKVTPGYEHVNIWGGYGRRPHAWNVTSNVQEVRERQAKAIMKGAKQRQLIWKMLNDERSEIRRKMVQRFGEKFDPVRKRR